MQCPSCGTEAAVTQKFCAECGASLSVPCPGCGEVNPPGHKFCPECGTPLGGPAPEPVEPSAAPRPIPERRFVSVLFADLVGFTPFSERRDPEEVRALLTRYFERSRGIIERYSGTVDKFIGDAVMAVWGAVEAHEDDAERAVRAALDLVDAVADLGAEIGVPDLRLRAGVLTGETAVGPEGNERGLVVGDLVNTASRLQSIAEPGTVFVGAPTHELVQHVVECTPAGRHELKGKTAAVEVFRAERVIAGHGGRFRAETVEPPFVGRDDELRLLKDQLHAAGRERRSRMVSIVGEAGIGKTRLAWELFKYVDGLPEDTYWHQGRSPSYGDGLTLWPLGEMVRRRAGIAETDEAQKSRMKLRTALAEYVADDEERRWLEPWLAGLLGLEEMPTGERSELFAALRTLFQRVADRDQTVLVFEDLHWADEGTLEFITDLIERSQHHPILVVTLSRPDLLERHPGWGSGRRATASIRLEPLPDEAMEALVGGMAPGMPDDTIAAVVGRAAGVPLYAVEFVRMLLASGHVVREGDRFRVTGTVSGMPLPDSLQAVIGARLDRLDPEQRSLVQDAAVLGQSFTVEGLGVLREGTVDALTSQLMDLVRKELFELDEDPRSPERGQYHFVQPVVREVAYGRLSRQDRHRAHLRVADYMERLDEPELASVLASHLQSARETASEAEAAGLLERALAALARAADRAASLHAYPHVLAVSEQAMGMAGDDDARAPFWERAAAAAGALSEIDRAVGFARRALVHAEDSGDAAARLRTARLLASIMAGSYRANEAVEVLEPIAAELGDDRSDEAVRLLAEMGRAFMLVGRHRDAVDACDRALAVAERRSMLPTVIDAIITKGTALGNEHRPQESIVMLRGAADLAREHDNPWLQVRALNNLTVILQEMDPRASIAVEQEMLPLVRRSGDMFREYQHANVMSSNLVADGRIEEAGEMMARYDDDSVPEFWRQVWTQRRAFIAFGSGEASVDGVREQIGRWDDVRDPQLRSALDLLKATVALLNGEFDDAFDRARSVHDTFDTYTGGCLWTMAYAGAWSRDRARLTEALARLDASGLVGRYPDALRAYLEGALAALDGDTARAAQRFAASMAGVDRVSTRNDQIMVRLTLAVLVGLDHPAAAEAAAEAAAWIAETGVERLRSTFGDGLPPAPAAAETA